MGRGLGPVQKAILGALSPDRWLTIAELVSKVSYASTPTVAGAPSVRSVTETVRALEARGLVRVSFGLIGWTVVGEGKPRAGERAPINGLQVWGVK